MRFILIAMVFFQSTLVAMQTDFDVAIVGTSPVAMLEAIYHAHLGKKVLIVEADEQYGGAWETIAACGLTNNVEIIDRKLDSIYIDPDCRYVELVLGCCHFTTATLIVTQAKWQEEMVPLEN